VINERLGKPEFDCLTLDETYDCGCGPVGALNATSLGNLKSSSPERTFEPSRDGSGGERQEPSHGGEGSPNAWEERTQEQRDEKIEQEDGACVDGVCASEAAQPTAREGAKARGGSVVAAQE
jgi:hypothetical protein